VDEDDEPKDATKIDEFRLDDLANEVTRAQQRPSTSAKSSEGASSTDDDKTGATTASARSPKDKM